MSDEQMSRVAAARFWQFLDTDVLPTDDLAEDFHEASKLYRSTMGRSVRADKLQANAKLRQSAAIGARELAHLPLVALPPIDADEEYGVSRPFIRPPSCRSFSPQGIPVGDLGRLLWLAYGAYPEIEAGAGYRRPVASGGALYPLEVYVMASLDGMGEKGLYHYNVHRHGLEEVRPTVSPDDLRRLGDPAELLAQAPAIVLISSLFWRARFKYGLLGYRFALLEAGALIQQLTLVAQELGLGALPFAGIFDDAFEELCEVDGVDESFLSAVLLGVPV